MGFLSDMVRDALEACDEVADRIDKWMDGEER